MSIASMKKLSVIGHTSVRADLLQELMSYGIVEIRTRDEDQADDELRTLLSLDGNQSEADHYESWINRTVQALETLERYGTWKKPFLRTRALIPLTEFEEQLKDKQHAEKAVQEIGGFNNQLALIQTAQNKLLTSRLTLSPWADYDLPLSIHDTKETDVIQGAIPRTASPDLLKQQLLETAEGCLVEVVNGDPEQFYLSIIILKSERQEIEEVLKTFGFNRIQFTGYSGTARESIAEIDGELAKLDAEKSQVIESIRAIQSEKQALEYFHDHLVMKRDQALIRNRLLVSRQTFYFDGWMPGKARERVETFLKEKGCYYEIADPSPDEKPPVLLLNGRTMGAFESIGRLYALPDYWGLDATPYLAVSYAIFFGMMLSDAAYGLILSVATFVIMKKFRLEGMLSLMMRLFFYCGISTIFWGVMFGGYFADILTVVAKTFFNADVPTPALWFSPMENPMLLLVFCFILGGIHLFVGMGLNAYLSIKDGKPLDALFDVGFWYLLIIGLVMLLVGFAAEAGKWVAIAGAVGIFLTAGRDRKGIGKIVGGLGSLYGITGYLSDVLSYSRLLALGLATGVIGSVVNTMGSLGGGGIVGVLIMTIAFVIGHTYNMAINMLGSFVHSCRLEYVEFFGKFYRVGGEAFDPYRERTKYIEIKREDH